MIRIRLTSRIKLIWNEFFALLAVGRLGDRKGIEKQTTTWDKAIVDRRED